MANTGTTDHEPEGVCAMLYLYVPFNDPGLITGANNYVGENEVNPRPAAAGPKVRTRIFPVQQPDGNLRAPVSSGSAVAEGGV
jgi:hypothetical protein